MGLFDSIFGGGNKTRDEKSVQSDINKSLKASGGEWTSNLNDLVAERDRARSGATTSGGGLPSLSAGLGRVANAGREIGSNIARDVKMGTSAGLFSGRDKQAENLANNGFSPAQIQDYFARTDATIARNQAQAGAMQNEGSSDPRGAVMQDMPPEDQMPRYRNPFGSMPGSPGQVMDRPMPTAPGGKGFSTVGPQPGEISPDMRREALRIFESQRGAGQVPYQMMPYQQGLGSMQGQSLSPAFQNAAQNYSRLGGSQRLMDRPMEMMSVAERQRINEMSQGMADMQRPTTFPGKGAGTQSPQSDVARRIMPLISQMGIGGLRGVPRTMA